MTIGPGPPRIPRERAQPGTMLEKLLMSGDPRVQDLLEEILESRRTPEEVCQACPELLSEVRDRLRRLARARGTGRLVVPHDGIRSRAGRAAGRKMPRDSGLRRPGDRGARRDGDCLQGPPLTLEPGRRSQNAASRGIRGSRRAGAVSARSRGGGGAAPPEHRAGLRCGRP